MLSARVDTMVPKIQAILSGKPVTRAWIFGSYSRGEETPQSDIDIMVQFDDSRRMSLMDISRIMVELSKALGIQVDLVEDGKLLPFAAASTLLLRKSMTLYFTNNAVNQHITVIAHKLAMFMRNFLGEQILSYYL